MKVLLINPSLDIEKIFGKFGKFMEPMPCIGLAYIAAMLEKNNIDVRVIDDFALRKGLKHILEVIKEYKPDVVGISCLTPAYPSVQKIAEEIKKYDKSIKIVLGNLHATLFADDILKNRVADFVVHGEGEYTTLNLVKALEKGGEIKNVKGISFLEGGQFVKTENAPFIENLNDLPIPAWHLFPYKKYGLFPIATIKRPILTVLGSRGCPHRCTFCALEYMGKKYRKRSPKNIADEIEFLMENFSVKQIGFVDQSFPFLKDHAMEFCDEMIGRGLNKKVIWTSETRVDSVDKELLQKMKEAGCRRIMYGIESGVQELLDRIKKNFKLEDVRRAVRESKEAGLETVGFFMLGLPGENMEMTRQTIDFAKSLDLDFAKFAITIPLPGSEIFENKIKEGKLKPSNWEAFSTLDPKTSDVTCISEGMSREEMIKTLNRATFEFYVRPKTIFNLLLKVRTVELKYFLYAAYVYFSSKFNA